MQYNLNVFIVKFYLKFIVKNWVNIKSLKKWKIIWVENFNAFYKTICKFNEYYLNS